VAEPAASKLRDHEYEHVYKYIHIYISLMDKFAAQWQVAGIIDRNPFVACSNTKDKLNSKSRHVSIGFSTSPVPVGLVRQEALLQQLQKLQWNLLGLQ
jgi:hypothetical protein